MYAVCINRQYNTPIMYDKMSTTIRTSTSTLCREVQIANS